MRWAEGQPNPEAWASNDFRRLPPDGATLSSRQELSIAAAEHKAEIKAQQVGNWKEWGKGKGGKAEKEDGEPSRRRIEAYEQ